jgi:peptidoglycan/xylan/chitin deacetylase (PgdA/CDA1 family)
VAQSPPPRAWPQLTKGAKAINDQFFAREDGPVAGPPRDLLGYGEHPPAVRWKDDATVAISIVMNYEEGSEQSFPMGDGQNDFLTEIPFVIEGKRDLAFESGYEYGSRAGIWRLFRIFEKAAVPVTVFATAVALERNPAAARRIARRGDEVAAHGYRWTNAFEMTREEERHAIELAVESIANTVGVRPVGWYHREMSVNTRALVVEEGGFLYDSEAYNDDLPYWTWVNGKSHLVVPYTLVVNDIRYVMAQGFGSPEDFFQLAKATLDCLRQESDGASRMMSIGLHPRLSGHPGRADALARFVDYAQQTGDVWFARRVDIAKAFMQQVPPSGGHAPDVVER